MCLTGQVLASAGYYEHVRRRFTPAAGRHCPGLGLRDATTHALLGPARALTVTGVDVDGLLGVAPLYSAPPTGFEPAIF